MTLRTNINVTIMQTDIRVTSDILTILLALGFSTTDVGLIITDGVVKNFTIKICIPYRVTIQYCTHGFQHNQNQVDSEQFFSFLIILFLFVVILSLLVFILTIGYLHYYQTHPYRLLRQKNFQEHVVYVMIIQWQMELREDSIFWLCTVRFIWS